MPGNQSPNFAKFVTAVEAKAAEHGDDVSTAPGDLNEDLLAALAAEGRSLDKIDLGTLFQRPTQPDGDHDMAVTSHEDIGLKVALD